MPVDRRLDAEAGKFSVTGNPVNVRRHAIRHVVQKNWWLILLYVVITIGGLLYTYLTGTLIDVAVAAFVAIITFFVGLKMLKDVNTETDEIR